MDRATAYVLVLGGVSFGLTVGASTLTDRAVYEYITDMEHQRLTDDLKAGKPLITDVRLSNGSTTQVKTVARPDEARQATIDRHVGMVLKVRERDGA